jgi:hypothetical protein
MDLGGDAMDHDTIALTHYHANANEFVPSFATVGAKGAGGIGDESRQRPLIAVAVALGVGSSFSVSVFSLGWLKRAQTLSPTLGFRISRRIARALWTLSASETRRTSPSAVFEAAKKRLHRNVLAIALANKLARIAWSVLVHGRNFEVRKIDEAAAQSV